MDKYQIEYRNRVLRDYIRDRNWDKNDEYLLKQQLVKCSTILLPEYPYLIEDEWEVETSQSDKGKGDLVFASEYLRFAVVEIKYIDRKSTGRTASRKRTAKRQEVKQQAIDYAAIYARRHLQNVEVFTFTNEKELPCSLGIYNPHTASCFKQS
ncbi:hypothetical protein [Chamaesiphon minutus]|uniref:Uncharacterized protein n=1 Tax=Chamaesiphon minutus (strain ATCC 27169 / PCC 6605) TaxID=1173020 RepID=K9UE99_CHAP6|nr:hypothetical protein [Chamaesiphon minutus]AFY93155.1 hypothetical protein Cha6605_2060 [Chamaesiphon minutus PCC 6605]